jgi:hypothetical protein
VFALLVQGPGILVGYSYAKLLSVLAPRPWFGPCPSMLEARLGMLGPCWAMLRPYFGPFQKCVCLFGHTGAVPKHAGAMPGHAGAMLGHAGVVPLTFSRCFHVVNFGCSAMLGLHTGMLGPCPNVLGPCPGTLAPCRILLISYL